MEDLVSFSGKVTGSSTHTLQTQSRLSPVLPVTGGQHICCHQQISLQPWRNQGPQSRFMTGRHSDSCLRHYMVLARLHLSFMVVAQGTHHGGCLKPGQGHGLSFIIYASDTVQAATPAYDQSNFIMRMACRSLLRCLTHHIVHCCGV